MLDVLSLGLAGLPISNIDLRASSGSLRLPEARRSSGSASIFVIQAIAFVPKRQTGARALGENL